MLREEVGAEVPEGGEFGAPGGDGRRVEGGGEGGFFLAELGDGVAFGVNKEDRPG